MTEVFYASGSHFPQDTHTRTHAQHSRVGCYQRMRYDCSVYRNFVNQLVSLWQLELSRGGNIHNTEVGKCYKSEISLMGSGSIQRFPAHTAYKSCGTNQQTMVTRRMSASVFQQEKASEIWARDAVQCARCNQQPLEQRGFLSEL